MLDQIVMVSLDDLVPTTHNYRKFTDIWNFASISDQLKNVETDIITKAMEFKVI